MHCQYPKASATRPPEHASRTIAPRYDGNHNIIGLKSAIILKRSQQMTSLLVKTGRRTWLRFAPGIGACITGACIAVFADGNAFAQASGKVPDFSTNSSFAWQR